MAYRRRNRLRRRNARPFTKRAIKRTGRSIKGVTSVAYRRPGLSSYGMAAFRGRASRVGRGRSAARTALLNQRRRRRVGVVGGGEIGFVRKYGGKYRPYTVPKLVTMGLTRVTYRYQGVNRMNANTKDAGGTFYLPPGWYRLSNNPNNAGSTSNLLPLHVFDLTTVRNVTSTPKQVGYSLGYVSDVATSPSWFGMSSQVAGGGTNAAGGWEYEDTNGSGSTFLSSRYIEHEWFDMRFTAYGARSQPTYYDIMVVQFSREHLAPRINGQNANGFTTEQNAQYSNFWAGLAKNISYNAILPGAKDVFKGMRILRRFRFTIQPSMSDEVDRNPNMRIVRLFQKHYRCNDFGFGPDQTQTNAQVDGPNYIQNNTSSVNDFPLPTQRVYLLVRASNTTEVAYNLESADDTPSYDMCLRKQVRIKV